LTPRKETVFHRMKENLRFELKENTVLRTGLFASAIAGAIAFVYTGPVLLDRDDSCFNQGRAESCGFKMKWMKSEVNCVEGNDRFSIISDIGGPEHPLGASEYKSGDTVQGIKVTIKGPSQASGYFNILFEEGPVGSWKAVPGCPK